MSGLYLPGMEMPKACVYRENGHFMTCPLYDVDGYCGALNREAKHDLETKLCDCPLVPVPDHGRLIDADVICAECKRVSEEYDGIYPDCSYCPVNLALAVIEADKEGEG